MALKLVTPPATEPITLAQAKAHLRVDHTDDDVTITDLITVARSHCDAISGWLGRALITQTWKLTIDSFPLVQTGWCGCAWPIAPANAATAIKLPYPPLQSVTSIKYLDTNGVQQTMSSTDYMIDNASDDEGWIIPVTAWPSTKATANAVEITFVAGWTSPRLPPSIPHAIKLFVGHLYENREEVVMNAEGGATVLRLPLGVEQLLNPFRVVFV